MCLHYPVLVPYVVAGLSVYGLDVLLRTVRTRATMGYVGCATIDEMRKKPSFVKVTGAGQRESHVHDVQITKEPPNYRMG